LVPSQAIVHFPTKFAQLIFKVHDVIFNANYPLFVGSEALFGDGEDSPTELDPNFLNIFLNRCEYESHSKTTNAERHASKDTKKAI